MPTAEIQIIETRKGYVLNDFTALHLRALQDFTDFYGKKRRAGEEWLIDKSVKDVHIIDAPEDLVQEKKIIVLTQNQFCIIKNPICKKTGMPLFGRSEIRRGEAKFFLQPKEELYEGIKNIMVINEEEALLVRAMVPYFDKRTKKDYKPGQKWLIKGPIDFIPENEIEVIEKR
jgi:major vault protein